MSALALEEALRRLGVEGRIEAREGLAVLVSDGGAELADASLRRRATALAREHGFTHLALELVGGPDAGRGDAPGDGAALHRD